MSRVLSRLDRYRAAAPHPERFVLGAVPLSRPDIVAFLSARPATPRGTQIAIVGQRPVQEAEQAWLADLGGDATGTPGAEAPPRVDGLLAIDDPHLHLRAVATDRIVPAPLLDEDGFLTRNLGGWAPVYFDVFGLPAHPPADPVLAHLEPLVDFGGEIDAITADPELVAQRLPLEVGGDAATAARMLVAVDACRRGCAPDEAVSRLVGLLHRSGDQRIDGPVADVVVFDALLSVLTAVEERRRRLLADGDHAAAEELAASQVRWREEEGLIFILKGEYIAGRHRRSTVLIAPALGAVVKQPAPEPLHDIALDHRTVDGASENWPQPVDGGYLVTPRGRLRMMLSDGAFPLLANACDYPVTFCSLLGLHVEPYVAGRTLQAAAQQDPALLTAELYEEIVLHQQVCEVLGVDNADWHAANFMVRATDEPDLGISPTLVHVDWGAARSLADAERGGRDGDAPRRRLDQVRNLAFSFHDEHLAERVSSLHARLVADGAALDRIRRHAIDVVARRGLRPR